MRLEVVMKLNEGSGNTNYMLIEGGARGETNHHYLS
jgi:hypothetical protein